MGNLYFNIRFGIRHLQLDYDWKLSFKVNRYWIDNKPDKWFEVYTAFGMYFT